MGEERSQGYATTRLCIRPTTRELFDAMIEFYPDRANLGSLWGGAKTAKREVAAAM